MIYLCAFLFSGFICFIGELLIDGLKLKPGIVTSLFVSIGAFLELFDIYDFFVERCGGGAMVVISSFGHLLTHSTLAAVQEYGLIGLYSGIFNLTTAGITSTIIFAFFISLIFRPKS